MLKSRKGKGGRGRQSKGGSPERGRTREEVRC